MTDTAPVILFLFNRPYHTLRTIEALQNNEGWDKTDVYVFCDGPKHNASAEQLQRIAEVRAMAHNISGCKSIHVFASEKNKGLYQSVLDGVGEIFKSFEKIIVLEDDLETAPTFLNYMNDALHHYENSESVYCISGYTYPIKTSSNEAFFIKGADCWGWATWKNRWNKLELDGKKLLNQLNEKNLINTFTFNGSYPYLEMLNDKISGANQSWAVLWYASALVNNGLCLYPAHSLVHNTGTDGTGTHGAGTSVYTIDLSNNSSYTLPDNIEEKVEKRKAFETFFQNSQPNTSKLNWFVSGVGRRLRYYSNKISTKISPSKKEFGWFGDYPNWASAQAKSTGYDQSNILNQVKDALLKVKYGVAVYERDSVIFDKVQLSEPLLKSLQKINDEFDGKLHLVDFGGSLGSSYFQNKNFIKNNTSIQWSIVEQKHFIECGKKYFEDENLHFFFSISDAQKERKNNVLLVSSVIQYFEKPYELIEELMSYDFDYIVIDRTAFVDRDTDRITLQIVPTSIYSASYPSWFFNKNKFIKAFEESYEMIEELESTFDPAENIDGEFTYRRGFLFKRKK
jgi:putative methyltransferase (TIGR04325 family)